MAKATVHIPQFQGTQRKLRRIEPTAHYVLGFDADKKLTALSGDSIVEAGEVTLTGTQEISGKTVVAQVVKTGLTASGSASNDFSASTGTFKTSSGANTLSGDVSIAAGKDVTFLAGDGALDASLGTGITKTTSGANTLSGDVSVAAGKDITYLAGDGAFDASLGTGITKTTSGVNTLSGDVSIAAGKDIAYLAGDGAFDASLGTGVFKSNTGLNTLGGLLAVKAIAGAVAAAGSDVTDAGQLGAANIVYISSDGATKGVKLGTGVIGQSVTIINTSATAAELYAASGGTINGLGANASVVIPASKGVKVFCSAADTWQAFDLTALAAAS